MTDFQKRGRLYIFCSIYCLSLLHLVSTNESSNLSISIRTHTLNTQHSTTGTENVTMELDTVSVKLPNQLSNDSATFSILQDFVEKKTSLNNDITDDDFLTLSSLRRIVPANSCDSHTRKCIRTCKTVYRHLYKGYKCDSLKMNFRIACYDKCVGEFGSTEYGREYYTDND